MGEDKELCSTHIQNGVLRAFLRVYFAQMNKNYLQSRVRIVGSEKPNVNCKNEYYCTKWFIPGNKNNPNVILIYIFVRSCMCGRACMRVCVCVCVYL